MVERMEHVSRRWLLAALAAAPLAGCATSLGGYSVEEAIRRLLLLSTERAFARLTAPGGFYEDQLTRILPPQMGDDRGGAIVSALLRTRAVRDRVELALNDLAVDVADSATPIVMDAVRQMSFADALAVLRGGPTAATDILARQARDAVVDTLLPGTSRGLRSDLFEMLSAVVSASSGTDLAALTQGVAGQIGDAIFRAIGREEADIRRDPRSSGDPLLSAMLQPAP